MAKNINDAFQEMEGTKQIIAEPPGIISISESNINTLYYSYINNALTHYGLFQSLDINKLNIDYILAFRETNNDKGNIPDYVFMDYTTFNRITDNSLVIKKKYKFTAFEQYNHSTNINPIKVYNYIIGIVEIDSGGSIQEHEMINNLPELKLLSIFRYYLQYVLDKRGKLNLKITGGKKQEKQTIQRKVSYDKVNNKYYINYDSKKCYLTKHNIRVNKKKLFMTINGVEIMIKLK